MPVPHWARDAGGKGATRQFDFPCIGTDDPRPPFTCGSETRRRLIKYFVRDFIGEKTSSGKLTTKLVRDAVRRLQTAWATETKDLICMNVGTTCDDLYLPVVLEETFDEIKGEHVMREIFAHMGEFHEHVMTHAEPFYRHATSNTPLDPYDWEGLGFSESAQWLGLFDSKSPVMNYSLGEVGYPFKNRASLWDHCVGMVSQVIFTLPMGSVLGSDGQEEWSISTVRKIVEMGWHFDPTMAKDFDGTLDEESEDVAGTGMLERYVGKLLEHAFRSAPTFWFYALRHVPSDSLTCRRDSDIVSAGASLSWSDLGDYGLVQEDVQNIPVHGYAAFPLGGVNASCMCGWPKAGEYCLVPADLCAAIGESNCNLKHGSAKLEAVYGKILSYWTENENGSLIGSCPESDFSDAWGVMPARIFDGNGLARTWVQMDEPGEQGVAMRGKIQSLLHHSQAGLRAGTLGTISESARRANINPSSRVHALRSESGDVSLKRCAGNILSTFDADSVVDDIVDDLFPAAQGVKEGMPVSTCLRYATEYLRLRVTQSIHDSKIRDVGSRLETLKEVAATWRARCEVQLEMVGMCKSNGVFEIIPEVEKAYECPFQVVDPAYESREYYVIPTSCIVYVGGVTNAFFDPCKPQGSCSEHRNVTVGELIGNADDFELQFDVRDLGRGDALGVWPVQFMSGNEAVDAQMKEIVDGMVSKRVVREAPWRLRSVFAQEVVQNGKVQNLRHDGDAGRSWATSEGFSSGEAAFCDSVVDWWPSDWTKPVGYHVTVPCQNASWRTFDSAFVVQYDADRYVATMRYVGNAMRHRTRSISEYGMSGFCRRGVYGQPMFETNTVRVCTRDSKGATYDGSAPIKPSWDGVSFEDEEHCSTTPYEVPWSVDEGDETMDPTMFSTGFVSLSPPAFFVGGVQNVGLLSYPPATRTSSKVYAGFNQSEGWGDRCHNDGLFECAIDTDCSSLAIDASIASKLKCFRGVCIVLEPGYCYMHEHCAATKQMCSGEGRCEDVVWQVQNDFGEEIEFEIFGDDCTRKDGAGRSFDTTGASPWHHVPDILQKYGMCSYRSFFEFQDFVNRTGGTAATQRDARGGVWHGTGLRNDASASLFNQKKFRVHSHPCDMDYQHMNGLQACVPEVGQNMHLFSLRDLNDAADTGDVAKYVEYSRTFYRRSGGSVGQYDISMSTNANFDNPYMGFLHPDRVFLGPLSASAQTSTFQYCRELLQCHEDSYGLTFNGAKISVRHVATFDSVTNAAIGTRVATAQDASMCGIFGIYDAAKQSEPKCRLDYAFAPLYYAVCVKSGGMSSMLTMCGKSFSSHCTAISAYQTYRSQGASSTPANLATIADAINNLWNAVASAGSVASSNTRTYINKMDCANHTYTLLQEVKSSDHWSFNTPYHVKLEEGGVDGVLNQVQIAGGYYLSPHGLREFPFLWWQKCCMMHSATMASAAVSCPMDSWAERFSYDGTKTLLASGYDLTQDNNLYKIDAGLTSSILEIHEQAFRWRLAAQMSDQDGFKGAIDYIADKVWVTCKSDLDYVSNLDNQDAEAIIYLLQFLKDGRGFYQEGSDESLAIRSVVRSLGSMVQHGWSNASFSKIVTGETPVSNGITDLLQDIINNEVGNGVQSVNFLDDSDISNFDRKRLITHRILFPAPDEALFRAINDPKSNVEMIDERRIAYKTRGEDENTLSDLTLGKLRELQSIKKDELRCRRSGPRMLERKHCDDVYNFVTEIIQSMGASETGYRYPGVDAARLRVENERSLSQCYDNVAKRHVCKAILNSTDLSPCYEGITEGETLKNKFMRWAQSSIPETIKYKQCRAELMMYEDFNAKMNMLPNNVEYRDGKCYQRNNDKDVVQGALQLGLIGFFIEYSKPDYFEYSGVCPNPDIRPALICDDVELNEKLYTAGRDSLEQRVLQYLHSTVSKDVSSRLRRRNMEIQWREKASKKSAFTQVEFSYSSVSGGNRRHLAQPLLVDIGDTASSNGTRAAAGADRRLLQDSGFAADVGYGTHRRDGESTWQSDYATPSPGKIRVEIVKSCHYNRAARYFPGTPVCDQRFDTPGYTHLPSTLFAFFGGSPNYQEAVASAEQDARRMYTDAVKDLLIDELWGLSEPSTVEEIGCIRGRDYVEHVLERRDFHNQRNYPTFTNNLAPDALIFRKKHITGRHDCTSHVQAEDLLAGVQEKFGTSINASGFKPHVFQGSLKQQDLLYQMANQLSSFPADASVPIQTVMKWIYMLVVTHYYGRSSGESVDATYDNVMAAVPQRLKFHTDTLFQGQDAFVTLDTAGLADFNDQVNDLKSRGKYSCDGDQQVIPYGSCFVQGQDSLNGFSKLYRDAQVNYDARSTMEGGVVIPDKTSMMWTKMSYSHGMGRLLPSWSNHTRALRMRFAKWILNDQVTCRMGSLDNTLCMATAAGVKIPANPWLGGGFNPFVFCDVRGNMPGDGNEHVDTYCNENLEVCDQGGGLFYLNQPHGTFCQSRDGSSPDKPSMPSYVTQYDGNNDGRAIPLGDRSEYTVYDNNLCAHKPVAPTSCTHKQGMLGARTGMSIMDAQEGVDDSADSLYSGVPVRNAPVQRRGLFMGGGNTLFTENVGENEDVLYSILHSHPNEVGGHHIVMRVLTDDTSALMPITYLSLERVPLTSKMQSAGARADYLWSMQSKPVRGEDGWLRNLRYAMALESKTLIDPLYPQQGQKDNRHWSCPLRRISFWSGNITALDTFSPLTPDPLRAGRMFNNVEDGVTQEGVSMNFYGRSHPTQLHVSLASKLPHLFTSNGFCICPNSLTGCVVGSGNSGVCSLPDTIKSLVRSEWRQVTVKGSTSACKQQLDWPLESGDMRDGTPKQSYLNSPTATCDVTSRIPPFQYRYVFNHSVTKSPTGDTSLSPGGACHMGRAKVMPKGTGASVDTESRLCSRVAENATHTRVKCVNSDGTPEFLEFEREAVVLPAWAVEGMKQRRQYCDTCSPLPTWKYQAPDDVLHPLPKGPEVSYGVPFRWSGARLLAADVKKAVCGSLHDSSQACKDKLNLDAWVDKALFYQQFHGDIRGLFREGLVTNVSHKSLWEALSEPLGYEADEDRLWTESGWVACTQEQNATCYGTISKGDWYDPAKNKAQMCTDEYASQVAQGRVSDAVGVDICNIDYGLADLCSTIQSARQMVQEANCLVAGSCSPSMFTYSPGTYHINNRQFSRETVIDFYEFRHQSLQESGGTLVCEEPTLAQYSAIAECASVKLEVVQQMLEFARMVLKMLIRVGDLVVRIIFTLFKMLVPDIDIKQVIREAMVYFQRLIHMCMDLLRAFGDMFFRVIFELDGIGGVLKAIVQAMCEIINGFLWVWNNILCPIVHNVAVPILEFVRDAFKEVNNIVNAISAGSYRIPFIDELVSIMDIMIQTLRSASCDVAPLDCTFSDGGDAGPASATLPVASRCWVNYRDSIDDRSPYSCTLQDTCVNRDAESGEELLGVCDACGVVDPTQFNRYGCDTYTKQCTCMVSVAQKTPCLSMAECNLPQSSCTLVNDAQYPSSNAFGIMARCTDCATGSVTCLRDGLGAGQCSCVIQNFEMQTCRTPGDAGFIPYPNYMCGVYGVGELSGAYRLNWYDIALAPCGSLPLYSYYCVQTQFGNIVVGAATPSTAQSLRRRLLSMDEGNASSSSDDEQGQLEAGVFASWNHTSEPCRSLMTAAASPGHAASTLDAWYAQRCKTWRIVANNTIRLFNLTTMMTPDAPCDHFLLSLTDFLDVVSRKGVALQLWTTKGVASYVVAQGPMLQKLTRYLTHLGVSLGYPMSGISSTLVREWDALQNRSMTDEWMQGQLVAAKVLQSTQEFRADPAMDPIKRIIVEQVQDLFREAQEVGSSQPGGDREYANGTASDESHPSKGTDGEARPPKGIHAGKRKLMGIQEDIQLFSTLSGQDGSYDNIPLSQAVADNWLQGPFAWPMHWDVSSEAKTCSALTAVADIVKETGAVAVHYARHGITPRVLSYGLFDNIPKIYQNASDVADDDTLDYAGDDLGGDVMKFIYNNFLAPLGLTNRNIRSFFNTDPKVEGGAFFTFKGLISDMAQCDFESVMLCSKHVRPWGTSVFLAYLFYVTASVFMGAIGLGAMTTPLFYLIPIVSMWLAYNISPLCGVMIPTCFLEDTVESIKNLLPLHITWPLALQVYPHCLDTSPQYADVNIPPEFANVTRGSGGCLRSCREDPFGFDSWQASVSWILCNLDVEFCTAAEIPFVPELEGYTLAHAQVLKGSDADLVTSFNFCFFGTVALSIPVLLLVFIAGVVVSALAKLPLSIASSLTNTVVQAWANAHAHVSMSSEQVHEVGGDQDGA